MRTRHGWCRTANRLPVGRHRQTAVLIQRLVGVHQYVGPRARKRPSVAVRAATSPRRISGRLKNCTEPPTNGCSTASSTTNTTFCTIYCRRNLKRLNVTICARAHTTLNYQNVVRVSQTAVTLNACYSRIFTKYCSTLLTELTVLTVK